MQSSVSSGKRVVFMALAWLGAMVALPVQAERQVVAVSQAQVSAAEIARHANPNTLMLRSSSAVVMDPREGVVLMERNVEEQRPIASLTKLMTAMVVLDAKLPLDATIRISREDRDRLRGTGSRLDYGVKLTRRDVLLAALGGSDNRAAAALARTYAGGRTAMMRAMNDKARRLGMHDTHYADSSGLSSDNVSTARDMATLVLAARKYPLLRELSTDGMFSVRDQRNGRVIEFFNTNRLVRSAKWAVNLSKTGYTADAGNCLVMETVIGERPVIIVLLNSWGKLSKYGDSGRIRDWLLKAERKALRVAETPT